MRKAVSYVLMAALLSGAIFVRTASPTLADAPGAPASIVGGIAAHLAKFDFNDSWDESVDWEKLDGITRELAPDHLDWNALCLKATGQALADYPNGLPAPLAEKFISALASQLKAIASNRHVELTQNDWAIVGCAVVPLQELKGAGQKYVTGLGDTTRLGLAITKLTRSGVNCGDGCVLTQAVLKALGIESRFVGCHRKVSLQNQPAGHAMIEYFETDSRGRRFGHIVDATNMAPLFLGTETYFRPPTAKFQIVGDRLGRLQFLISNVFVHEQPALQGFDPPFVQEELASPELADFATARWDARVDARSVVLESSDLEANVPVGKSVVYKIKIGTDVPEGSTPSARMYRKGADGMFHALTGFSLHRRTDSKEVRLVWDGLLDAGSGWLWYGCYGRTGPATAGRRVRRP